ncbi:MAG: 50S ribosomal protein L10 [Geminicoccaceae bacterium]|nr:50S ribosomal protein L10 [Geminicoccaceae bacterium]
MLRGEKTKIIDDLHEVFTTSGVVVVTHFSGMSVPEVTGLRSEMRNAGARFRVTKNSLAKRAAKGTAFEILDGLFDGPTAIAFSADPVAAPRVLSGFVKKNEKLKIVGAGLDGALLNEVQVKALADLPSLDELRAKIISLINTPASRMVGLLQAPGAQLARVLQAHAAQDQS